MICYILKVCMSIFISRRIIMSKSRIEEYAEITRQALRDSALELFVRKGFGKTSIENIVKKARVTRGAFYHHFKSKEDIFIEVYEGLAAQLVAVIEHALKDISDPWEKAVVGCRTFLDYCIDPNFDTIRLDDAIVVLGWKRWRQIDSAYTMKILRRILHGFNETSGMATDKVDLASNMVYAVLVEAALSISASREKQKTRDDVLNVVLSLLAGLKNGSQAI